MPPTSLTVLAIRYVVAAGVLAALLFARVAEKPYANPLLVTIVAVVVAGRLIIHVSWRPTMRRPHGWADALGAAGLGMAFAVIGGAWILAPYPDGHWLVLVAGCLMMVALFTAGIRALTLRRSRLRSLYVQGNPLGLFVGSIVFVPVTAAALLRVGAGRWFDDALQRAIEWWLWHAVDALPLASVNNVFGWKEPKGFDSISHHVLAVTFRLALTGPFLAIVAPVVDAIRRRVYEIDHGQAIDECVEDEQASFSSWLKAHQARREHGVSVYPGLGLQGGIDSEFEAWVATEEAARRAFIRNLERATTVDEAEALLRGEWQRRDTIQGEVGRRYGRLIVAAWF